MTNENARNFHQTYIKASSVPFSVFFEAFSHVLKDQEIQITAGLRKVISDIIDVNKNNFIGADEINGFFNTWESSEERLKIIAKAQQKSKQKIPGDLTYKIFMVVEATTPDPVTQILSFHKGSTFEITSEGMPSSKRFCADRCVYFGKENRQFKNDVEFSSADTRIKNLHFQIHTKRDGYYIVDNGENNGLKLKVLDNPVLIHQDSVLTFGGYECRVLACTAPRYEDEPDLWLSDFKSHKKMIGEAKLELFFTSEKVFGLHKVFNNETAVKIGGTSDCEITLEGLHSKHAIIDLRSSGWTLIDNQSPDGTWISINSGSNILHKKPSEPLRLINNMRFKLPGMEFKILYKSEQELSVSLSDNDNFRSENFRSLYLLDRKVKTEGNAPIFVCRHILNHKEYLVKIIKLKDLTPEFIYGVLIYRRLDHPKILRVHDTIQDGVNAYIVSEYCSGGELFERILKKPVHSEEESARIIREILQALAYLHSNNITHRHIIPENLVFVDESADSTLKLLNFSSSSSSLPYYSSPESFSSLASPKNDIWSCGVILYILLVGAPPFPGKTEEEIRKKILKGRPAYKEKAWERISNHGKRVVRLMLEPDISRRPTALELLNDPWIKQSMKFIDTSKPMLARTMKNFKHFYSSSKLYQSLLLFMSNSLMSEAEKQNAMSIFLQMDKNGDGKLSKQEILEGLSAASLVITEDEVNNILQEGDGDNDGYLNYSEFLMALSDKSKLLNTENVERTFAMFDQDGSGDITTAELKRVLGHSEASWTALITEIDENKDGKIDLKEFKSLLFSRV